MKRGIPVSVCGCAIIGPKTGVGLMYGFGVTGREDDGDCPAVLPSGGSVGGSPSGHRSEQSALRHCPSLLRVVRSAGSPGLRYPCAFRGGGGGRLMANSVELVVWYALVGELLLRRVSSSCSSKASRLGEICSAWPGFGTVAAGCETGEMGRGGVAAISRRVELEEREEKRGSLDSIQMGSLNLNTSACRT